MLVQVLAIHLLIQLTVNVLGKQVDEVSNTWFPVIHVGSQDAVPGSLFQPGPDLEVVPIWIMDQWIEDFSLSLFFNFFVLPLK